MADFAVRIRLFLDVAPLMYCTRILVLLSIPQVYAMLLSQGGMSND